MTDAVSTPLKRWQKQTESLLGFCGVGFAVILLIVYEFSGHGEAVRAQGHVLGYAVWAYLGFCLLRLLWVTQSEVPPFFGWLTAAIDVTSLSIILYVFGGNSGEGTPVYTLYYALIAMHAMRLNGILVLCLGIISILASVLMGATLFIAPMTMLPDGTVPKTSLFPGSEVEKLLSLMMFVVLTAVSVLRAKDLLSKAGQKESADIQMNEFKRASHEKTEIMTSMGKDLKVPMTEVSGMVDALRGTKLSSKQAEFLDAIEKSGGEILSIIDDIVDYTNLEMGKLEIRNSEFNLKKFIEQTVQSMASKAQAKRLDLLSHVAAGSPDLIVADEDRLKKVLINLIDNAITHTDEGAVLIEVECLPVDGKDANLFVRVKDTGVGISEDRMDLIFSPAALPTGSQKSRYGVMGLGLSVSRGIIRANGGDIEVISVVGKGSEFSFKIRVPYSFISLQKNKPFKATKSLNKLQVLIVDDAPLSANVLEKKLTDMGIMPKIVPSAEAACVALTAAYNANKPYEFAIVDYDMPDWNGLQLTKLIRTREQLDHMGLIALSASAEFGLQTSFENAGVTAFLYKPFRDEDLESAILKAFQLQKMVTTAPIQGFAASKESFKKSA